MTPEEILRTGVEILAYVLSPHGFKLSAIETGSGSGGAFANASFKRHSLWSRQPPRRLDLSFRYSLGLVTYSVGNASASHGAYMQALGVADQANYPGFSTDPLDGFRNLREDLQRFGSDFLSGDASVLTTAAAAEQRELEKRSVAETRNWSGDLHVLEQARQAIREKDYKAVAALFRQIRYPELLSPAERKMFELAAARSAGT